MLFGSTIFFYYDGSLWFQMIVITFLGGIYQLTNSLTNVYLVNKHKNGLDYMGYAMSG